jgi:hypothetical protein
MFACRCERLRRWRKIFLSRLWSHVYETHTRVYFLAHLLSEWWDEAYIPVYATTQWTALLLSTLKINTAKFQWSFLQYNLWSFWWCEFEQSYILPSILCKLSTCVYVISDYSFRTRFYWTDLKWHIPSACFENKILSKSYERVLFSGLWRRAIWQESTDFWRKILLSFSGCTSDCSKQSFLSFANVLLGLLFGSEAAHSSAKVTSLSVLTTQNKKQKNNWFTVQQVGCDLCLLLWRSWPLLPWKERR